MRICAQFIHTLKFFQFTNCVERLKIIINVIQPYPPRLPDVPKHQKAPLFIYKLYFLNISINELNWTSIYHQHQPHVGRRLVFPVKHPRSPPFN